MSMMYSRLEPPLVILSLVDVGRPLEIDMPPVVSVFAPSLTLQPLLGSAALPLPAPPQQVRHAAVGKDRQALQAEVRAGAVPAQSLMGSHAATPPWRRVVAVTPSGRPERATRRSPRDLSFGRAGEG